MIALVDIPKTLACLCSGEPSETFIEQLRVAGALTSGSTELSKAWRGAQHAVSATVDVAKYGAGFVVGLLEGSWNAVADLFTGAADMIELVAKTVFELVQARASSVSAHVASAAHAS